MDRSAGKESAATVRVTRPNSRKKEPSKHLVIVISIFLFVLRTTLKDFDNQLQVNAMILEIAVRVGDRLQPVPPIHFEVAPLPNAPDHADTDARNRDRLCGRVCDVPGSSHVDKRGEMQDIGASRQSENGDAGFKGPQKAVVTHK